MTTQQISAYTLARHLEITPARVYQMVQKGQLPFKLINGRKYFNLEEVLAHRKENECPINRRNDGASLANRERLDEQRQQEELAGHFVDPELDEESEEPEPDQTDAALRQAVVATMASAPPQGYARSRAIREQYAAALQKIKYEETVGLLTKTEDVAKVAFEVARTVRDKQQGIARRLAPVLAGETDERTVEEMIEHEINSSLEDMWEALKRRFRD